LARARNRLNHQTEKGYQSGIVNALEVGMYEQLLGLIEKSIDDHAFLTRQLNDGSERPARIVIEHGQCRAEIQIRNIEAVGPGGDMMLTAYGLGTSPEEAAKALIASLPFWAERLS
jgi:hypothetical protein